MRKSKKGDKQQPKPLRKNLRKDSRHLVRQETKEWCKQVQAQEEEEQYHYPSPAMAAPTSELHRCVSIEGLNEKRAWEILTDPEPDAEGKIYESVLYTNERGENVIQQAIRSKVSPKMIEYLVFTAGKQAVTMQNNNGYNALHLACKRSASSEVIDTLTFIGGKDSMYATDHCGELPIHKACRHHSKSQSTEIVKTLIDAGGKEMLEYKNDDEMLPLHCVVYYNDNNLNLCKILIAEGSQNVEGIGGLYSKSQDVSHEVKTVLEKLKEFNELESLVKDMDPAEAKATMKHGLINGVPWKVMQGLVEETDKDPDLELLVLAASGDKTDLSTVYELGMRNVNMLSRLAL